jgi:hypothetical protein
MGIRVVILELDNLPPSTEGTQYRVVLNIDLTRNTTALHHIKTVRITQEVTEFRIHRVSVEKGNMF